MMSTSYKVISYDFFPLLVTFSFGYFLVSEILVVLLVEEKKINWHNFDELDCGETFIENIVYILHISCPKMSSNDLIDSNIWRHFRPRKMKTTPIFSIKVPSHSSFCHPIFGIEIRSSRSELCRFFFPPVARYWKQWLKVVSLEV